MTTTERQKGILRHSLGIRERGNPYRNHFVTGQGSDDYNDCKSLVDQGLMVEHKGRELSGGDPIFTVTEQGKAVAQRSRPMTTTTQPRYSDVTVNLVGEDGNAFMILGRVQAALKRAGATRVELDDFRREAISGDYNHLLYTVQRWVVVE